RRSTNSRAAKKSSARASAAPRNSRCPSRRWAERGQSAGPRNPELVERRRGDHQVDEVEQRQPDQQGAERDGTGRGQVEFAADPIAVLPSCFQGTDAVARERREPNREQAQPDGWQEQREEDHAEKSGAFFSLRERKAP